MNTSWKTTLGGALSATGTALVGVGVVPQLGSGVPSPILTYIALAGFFCTAAGTFFSHLWAADADATAAAISSVQQQVTANSTSIISGSPAATLLATKTAPVAATPPVTPPKP